jgi:hypothetical protein
MQRSAGSTPVQGTIPFFSTNIWGSNSSKSDSNSLAVSQAGSGSNNNSAGSKSRPRTSSGDQSKDHSHSRKPSFGRKSSFTSPSKGKRRANSSASNGGGGGGGQIITDATAPPALPDYALAAAAKISKDTDPVVSPASVDSFSKMMSRSVSGSAPSNGLYQTISGPFATSPQSSVPTLPVETPSLYTHIQDVANKRISTLGYLRKA